jgi:hypothetical protein
MRVFERLWAGLVALLLGLATTGALGGAAALAAEPPVFVVPAGTGSGGTLPQHLAAADFDADGSIDVASANQGPTPLFGASVGVGLGTGTGALSAPVTTQLPSSWGGCDLAAGTFDAAPGADLMVLGCTTGGTGPLFALASDGDGTFTVRQQIANTASGQLAAADFSGDGVDDVAFSLQGTAQLRIYLGLGDGTFGPAATFTPPFSSWDVAAGDIDGDGDPDVVGAGGGPVWTMTNQGGGSFGGAASDSSIQAFELALADYNGDGRDDVAAVDASGGHVTAGLSQGNGHFTRTQQFSNVALQVSWVAAADFTGDGRADMLAQATGNDAALFAGNGAGAFQPRSSWVIGTGDLTPADLDGAGGTDVAAFVSDPGILYASVAGGRGFRAPMVQPGVSTETPVDVNGDGRPDIVDGVTALLGPGRIGSMVVTRLNGRDGRFGQPITSRVRQESASSGVGAITIGDIDEDGELDVVGGFENFLPNANNLFWAFGDGTGRFGSVVLSDSGDFNADILSLALQDVNGDGHLDIVSHTLDKLSVRLGNGDGTFDPAIASGSSGPSQQATLVADVTGDGVPDVVAVIKTGGEDFSSSDLRLHQGNGDGTFTLIQTRSVDSNLSEGQVADFDGDGRPDTAVVGSRGSNGGRSALWITLTTPAGIQGTPVAYEGPGSGLAVADLNADAAPDVATNGTSEIQIYTNAGDGTFPDISGVIAGGSVSVGADFTGDGRPDLLATGTALYVNRT